MGGPPASPHRRGGVARPAVSARDPRVARAARLLRAAEARAQEGCLALDGDGLIAEALAAGLGVEYVLEDATRNGEPAPWRPTAGSEALATSAFDVVPAAPDALRALAVLGQPPRAVAVLRAPAPPPPGLPPRSLVLAGVADAGNAGSLVRTAAALGLPRVWLTPGSADPWSRRALRASRGATLRPALVGTGVPLARLAAMPGRPPLAAAVPRGGVRPADLPAGAAVVLGGEGDGLDAAALALCDLAVTIPAPGFESLNVAAAGAILAWVLAHGV